MPLADSDVNDVLQEYVEKHHGFSHDIAYHLVKLAEASAIQVACYREIDQLADINFPEIMSLAQIYTHIDPRRKTIFSRSEERRVAKEKLLDALKESEGYRIAFPWEFEDDDDYVDEDRCEADYADEYVRDA